MFIQRFLGVALVLVVGAVGWRHREAWIGPTSAPVSAQAPVGAVLQAAEAAGVATSAALSPAAGVVRRVAPTPVGGPHKCRKGKRVIYTEGGCPEGTEEFAIQGGTVTVIAPTPVPKAADATGAKSERGGGKVIASPLISPYVQNDGPNIRQQTIERAVQQ